MSNKAIVLDANILIRAVLGKPLAGALWLNDGLDPAGHSGSVHRGTCPASRRLEPGRIGQAQCFHLGLGCL
jgi:hypothetical protein